MRILGWVLFFCAVTLIAGCSREPGVRAPNVLLLSLDTLRADHLGSYGYSRNTSPFLDELAREGVRFSNAFINCHPTPPSHVSILSSTYQETHKLFTNRDVSLIRSVPVEIPMLQEMLHSHGYTTLAVTGGGFTSSSIGFDRGFDEFSEDAGFDRLLELLEEESGDGSPIFAFVHTYEIHAPYAPPDRYRDLFGQFDSRFNPTARNLLDIHADASPLGSRCRRNTALCD